MKLSAEIKNECHKLMELLVDLPEEHKLAAMLTYCADVRVTLRGLHEAFVILHFGLKKNGVPNVVLDGLLMSLKVIAEMADGKPAWLSDHEEVKR
jgi:hypothetical protein